MNLIISRRNFLLGSGAAVTALALSPALKAIDGLVLKQEIAPHYRAIYDVILSCADQKMPGVARILYSLHRGEQKWPIFQIGMHPMAMMRWVAVPGGELIFRPQDVMRFEIDPSTAGTHIHIHSSDEKGEKFSETFHWKNDILIHSERVPLNLLPSEPDDASA